jgi:shikimate kinase
MSHLFLVGFMGSGKSTVGHLLAGRLGVAFVDLDEAVERRAGATVASIFAERGEQAFRELEHDELARLEGVSDRVVACGGGVVVEDRNRVLLKSLGRVVYLRVTADEALARIGSTEGRPMLSGGDPVSLGRTLLASRENLYAAVADVTVDTSGLTPEQVAERVESPL